MDLRKTTTQHLLALLLSIVLAFITHAINRSGVSFIILAWVYYSCTFRFMVKIVVDILLEHKTITRKDALETISCLSVMLLSFMISTLFLNVEYFNSTGRSVILVTTFILFLLFILPLLCIQYNLLKEIKQKLKELKREQKEENDDSSETD